MNQLNGGAFNLLVGRDPAVVKQEVMHLLNKHDLDFLNVQEARRYAEVLRDLPEHDYYTGNNKQTGILVRIGLKVDRFRVIQPGDGWWTQSGDRSKGSAQVQVRIDGWLLDRSIHLPTPSHWADGQIVDTPVEREDDLIVNMQALRRFFSPPRTRNAAAAGGDWNEPPETTGQYSPQWVRRHTNSRTYCPASRAGHGHIDWFMVKGCTIARIFKDTDIREGSDHEPVIALGFKKGR